MQIRTHAWLGAKVVLVVCLVAVALVLGGCTAAGGGDSASAQTGVQMVDSLPTTTPEATLVLTPTPTHTAVPTATSMATPTATPTATSTPALMELTENYLVLGVDRREGSDDPSWRTDTIMVVAIDRKLDRVGIVSVPRDLFVDIPGMGEGRINQADYFGTSSGYPGGGPALVQRMLTETLGIPTDHYVRIQMHGLVRLVDAMGGVTVTLDCPLYERTPDENSPNGVVDWNLPAGDVYLNGEDAKKFATYRYVTSDFGRTRRQQQLIWALRGRALQLDMIPRIPELWQALADTFETDMNVVEVAKLAAFFARLNPAQVHGLVLGREAFEDYVTDEGGWVLVVKDAAKLQEELATIFDAQSLATLGGYYSGYDCPPPPTPFPTYTPTLSPGEEPAPEQTATPAPGG